MSDTIQQTKNAITLKGSAKLVIEYLNYGINSILFQRGIYPPESFNREEHFGVSILVSTDEKINSFVQSVLGQIKEWLLAEKVKSVSLVIMSIATKEVLERWDFKLQYEGGGKGKENGKVDDGVGNKDLKTIQKEIKDVLLQICSTVSFLPSWIVHVHSIFSYTPSLMLKSPINGMKLGPVSLPILKSSNSGPFPLPTIA